MFQVSLLGGADLVELVNVDERKTIEIQFGIRLSWEIDAVRIVCTHGGRDEAAAECRFTATLRAYQQGRNIIRIFLICPTPVHDHVEKPAVKQVHPMLVFAGNGLRQSADTVFAVPDGEMVEEIFQRIEYRDAVGVDIPAYVPVP